MSSLSKRQKNEFRVAYNDFKNKCHKYGIENGLETPCKRVWKPNKTYTIDGEIYYKYQIAKIMEFIDNNEDIPTGQEFSHICIESETKEKNKKKKKHKRERGEKDVNSCITPDHIEMASHLDNCGRKKCHDNLKQYVSMKRSNQYTKKEDKLKPGPIYIDDIPEQIRKTGIFSNVNANKSKMYGSSYDEGMNNLRRSRRIKHNNMEYVINCNHDSHRRCFVNHKRM